MASEFIETTLKYQFANVELLDLALMAPHRSIGNEPSYDGNRELVKIGLHAVEFVAAHAATDTDNGTWGMFSFFFASRKR
jgi:dsRNA-specific ribonuclease